MHLEDMATLSLLSGVPRQHLIDIWREAVARRPGADPPGIGDLLARLGRGAPPSAAVAGAKAGAAAALARAREAGIVPVSWLDPAYPGALASIPDPPLVLWVRGRPASLAVPAVAIVGSRAASAYAVEVGRRLAADLAARGVLVVSGLARGVDSAAHRGAIEGGGETVAVLGSGPDVIYPPEHTPLAREICGRGAVVSECAPGTPPRKAHFPQRNRIISGLSLALVVVEASERSGSLITAGCALEQGRDVMVVPGNVLSGRNRGSHALLKDGAKVVESADDILEEFGPGRGGGSSRPGRPGADSLVGRMEPGEAYDLDALEELSGVAGAKLLPRLLELELQGQIRRAGGGRFFRPAGRW
jgi:DNA processing protein